MTDRLVNGTNGTHEEHSEPPTGADDAVEEPPATEVTLQELREVLERRRRQRETARAVTNGHGPTFNEHRQNRNPVLPLRREVGGTSRFFVLGTTNGWNQLCAEFPEEDLNRTLLDDTILTV
ncbi:hypothetical protein E4U32_002308 [Claviceps aff. humidiphila group G2b]|nr:hypothetical protein E4U32_002308 [Claviceps aff. humidiphila group G2b]